MVAAVRTVLPHVVVIDDGSSDATVEIAVAQGAHVLSHPVNQGKGAALKTGLQHASGAGFQFAITLDGDGQHDPRDLPKFVDAARLDDCDLVIGDRMGDTRSMPWVRRWVNRWMSRRISRRAGRGLPDTQCGYRLIRLASWRTLDLRTTGFEIESELLLASIEAGLRVGFVPVRTIYRTGQSKIHPLRDALRWFRWWWRR